MDTTKEKDRLKNPCRESYLCHVSTENHVGEGVKGKSTEEEREVAKDGKN